VLIDLDALVTAAEAAPPLNISIAAICMWRNRGKITVAGHRGRSPLYRYGDLLTVEQSTRHNGGRRNAA
jgi:hypothetical protein